MSKYKKKHYNKEQEDEPTKSNIRVFLNEKGKPIIREEDWEFEDRRQKGINSGETEQYEWD